MWQLVLEKPYNKQQHECELALFPKVEIKTPVFAESPLIFSTQEQTHPQSIDPMLMYTVFMGELSLLYEGEKKQQQKKKQHEGHTINGHSINQNNKHG